MRVLFNFTTKLTAKICPPAKFETPASLFSLTPQFEPIVSETNKHQRKPKEREKRKRKTYAHSIFHLHFLHINSQTRKKGERKRDRERKRKRKKENKSSFFQHQKFKPKRGENNFKNREEKKNKERDSSIFSPLQSQPWEEDFLWARINQFIHFFHYLS